MSRRLNTLHCDAIKRYTCATIKDNLFIAVSDELIVVADMTKCVQHALGITDMSEDARGGFVCVVKSPPKPQNRQLSAAAVLGQELYIAETPLADNYRLKLYQTDFAAMLGLPDRGVPVWTHELVDIDKYNRCLTSGVFAYTAPGFSVQLSTSILRRAIEATP